MPTNLTVVLGEAVEKLIRERREAAVPRSAAGFFESEPLCQWQRRVHSEGFAGAELVKSVYGWSLRYASGLDGFALLASANCGDVDGSFESAKEYARRWVQSDPTKRWVFTRYTVPAPAS